MKLFSIFKISLIILYLCSSNAFSREKEGQKVDTLKIYFGEQKNVALIKMIVFSDNTFSFYMKIDEDSSIINCGGTWQEKEDYIEHDFYKNDFLLSALFDTTKYAKDYSILDDNTIIFNKDLWSINIWGIWCSDILKTK